MGSTPRSILSGLEDRRDEAGDWGVSVSGEVAFGLRTDVAALEELLVKKTVQWGVS